jgi:hypothetical protein
MYCNIFRQAWRGCLHAVAVNNMRNRAFIVAGYKKGLKKFTEKYYTPAESNKGGIFHFFGLK